MSCKQVSSSLRDSCYHQSVVRNRTCAAAICRAMRTSDGREQVVAPSSPTCAPLPGYRDLI